MRVIRFTSRMKGLTAEQHVILRDIVSEAYNKGREDALNGTSTDITSLMYTISEYERPDKDDPRGEE